MINLYRDLGLLNKMILIINGKIRKYYNYLIWIIFFKKVRMILIYK